jgi:hypothetical protein
MSRGAARPSVTRGPGGGGFSRPAQLPARPSAPNIGGGGIGGGNINRGNIGGGTINGGDRVVNRPVNVGDIDVNRGLRGDYDGCCYHHPIAAGAAVAAGAAIASAAIGSTWYTLPPTCVVTVVNGVTYNQCGSTWLQPEFDGTTTEYVVVSSP